MTNCGHYTAEKYYFLECYNCGAWRSSDSVTFAEAASRRLDDLLVAIEDDQPDQDKLDAQIHAFLNNHKIRKYDDRAYYFSGGYISSNYIPRYCTSRDVLKSIRPKGWVFSINNLDGFGTTVRGIKHGFGDKVSSRYDMDSEELAELHAIIQAIAKDREQ